MTISDEFGDRGAWCVKALDDDGAIVGLANANTDGDSVVITFIGVRQDAQKHGMGAAVLDHLLAEARRLKLARVVGKDLVSAASWRLLCRKLGAGKVVGGCGPEQLPEQPVAFYFAPSFGLLRVESEPRLTAEWRL